MLKQKIKCHKFGNRYEKEHFFILNKGNNSGQPLPEYCANCFVFIADDIDEKEFFFFLFYGLWQGGLFRPFIGGSVIPSIRVDDLLKVIEEASKKVNIQRVKKSQNQDKKSGIKSKRKNNSPFWLLQK